MLHSSEALAGAKLPSHALLRKKVIVRALAGGITSGYLTPNAFVRSSFTPDLKDQTRTLDLLDLEGRNLPIPLSDVKFISFVHNFNHDDPQNPERLTRRTFLARPRGEGLWIRLTFTTRDQLEGLAPHDISLLDGVLEDAGLFFTPPDERANTHRIYVPRSAIATLELLGVFNPPSTRKATKSTPNPAQPSLFTT